MSTPRRKEESAGGPEAPQAGETFDHYRFREWGCVIAPEDIVFRRDDLSMVTRALFYRLVRRSQKGVVRVRQRFLAADLGMQVRALRNSLRELENAALVRTRRGGDGQPSTYYLLWHQSYREAEPLSDRHGCADLKEHADRHSDAAPKVSDRHSEVGRPAFRGQQTGTAMPVSITSSDILGISSPTPASQPDQRASAAAPCTAVSHGACPACRGEGIVATEAGGFAPVTWCTCPAAVALRATVPARVESFNRDVAALAARLRPTAGNRARRAAGGR